MKKLALTLLLAIMAPAVALATGQVHHATSKKNHIKKTISKTTHKKIKPKSHNKTTVTTVTESSNQSKTRSIDTDKISKTNHVAHKKPSSRKQHTVNHSKPHRHSLAQTNSTAINQENKKSAPASANNDESNDETVITKSENQNASSNKSQTTNELNVSSNTQDNITEKTISDSNSKVHDLLNYAQSLIGVRYHFGGSNPRSGFDCSGYVSYVFRQVAGVELPHNAAAISQVGTRISQKDLRPGDLVLFSTFKRGLNHVGIYLGDDRFVHASSSRTGFVEVSDIHDRYWSSRFREVRRLNLFNNPEI